MNDIRILLPWDELQSDERRAWNNGPDYVNYMRSMTRPITPEDIRSCLRMPDEWTPEEEKEYEESFYKKDGYNIWQVNESLDVAGKALDIATRPAPVEHKPCPFCGGSPEIKYDDYDGKWKWIECTKCNQRTTSKWLIDEAWSAWDRRTTDE